MEAAAALAVALKTVAVLTATERAGGETQRNSAEFLPDRFDLIAGLFPPFHSHWQD
jgi:hypothetical protein